jgi:Bacterial regulatory proteins, gntR family
MSNGPWQQALHPWRQGMTPGCSRRPCQPFAASRLHALVRACRRASSQLNRSRSLASSASSFSSRSLRNALSILPSLSSRLRPGSASTSSTVPRSRRNRPSSCSRARNSGSVILSHLPRNQAPGLKAKRRASRGKKSGSTGLVKRFGAANSGRRIYEGLRRAILDGLLRSGQRVPSTRALAVELDVSRLPVLTAYDQCCTRATSMAGSGQAHWSAPRSPTISCILPDRLPPPPG